MKACKRCGHDVEPDKRHNFKLCKFCRGHVKFWRISDRVSMLNFKEWLDKEPGHLKRGISK